MKGNIICHTDNFIRYLHLSICSSIALFEMPAAGGSSSRPITWPFLAAASTSPSGNNNNVNSAAAWGIHLKDDSSVASLVNLLNNNYNVYVPDILGKPGGCIKRLIHNHIA